MYGPIQRTMKKNYTIIFLVALLYLLAPSNSIAQKSNDKDSSKERGSQGGNCRNPSHDHSKDGGAKDGSCSDAGKNDDDKNTGGKDDSGKDKDSKGSTCGNPSHDHSKDGGAKDGSCSESGKNRDDKNTGGMDDSGKDKDGKGSTCGNPSHDHSKDGGAKDGSCGSGGVVGAGSGGNGGGTENGGDGTADSGQKPTCDGNSFSSEITNKKIISETCVEYEVKVSYDGTRTFGLSHFTMAIPCGEVNNISNSENWQQVFGKDPTTGVYGLKIDNIKRTPRLLAPMH